MTTFEHESGPEVMSVGQIYRADYPFVLDLNKAAVVVLLTGENVVFFAKISGLTTLFRGT